MASWCTTRYGTWRQHIQRNLRIVIALYIQFYISTYLHSPYIFTGYSLDIHISLTQRPRTTIYQKRIQWPWEDISLPESASRPWILFFIEFWILNIEYWKKFETIKRYKREEKISNISMAVICYAMQVIL